VIAAVPPQEPGTLSTAAWLGLNGEPVIDGKLDDSFLTDGIRGGLDGEYYRQDRLTVLAGRLPPPSATDEMVLTPGMASAFHLTVGDHMTWEFYQNVLVNGVPTGPGRRGAPPPPRSASCRSPRSRARRWWPAWPRCSWPATCWRPDRRC
jgi:hypothetical protein